MEFEHGESIEAIDLLSEFSFVVGGGKKVSLWDIRRGEKLGWAGNNKKPVSGVRVFSQGARFITISLDHYLKVYRSDTLELTYQ